MKPLYEYIIIKPFTETIETKRGALYIPETARDDKIGRGTVVAIGDGMITSDGFRMKPTVKVGDGILYWKHAAQELEFEGEKCVIVRECPDCVAYESKITNKEKTK